MVIGIIEDDNLLRKALDTSLKNQGYTMNVLTNGCDYKHLLEKRPDFSRI